MTLSVIDLALYTAALFTLFLTAGPVWIAVLARALSAGFTAAWPLALGVVVGDIVWPLLAILGVSCVVSVYGESLTALRWGACFVFVGIGGAILWHRDATVANDICLNRPGQGGGFVV